MSTLEAQATYGALDWMGSTFKLLGDGFTTGTPGVVLAQVTRQLRDGQIVTHVRDDNRELVLPLMVVGDDVQALNTAEAELVLEVHKARNLFSDKKPGMNTPVNVHQTFRGVLREIPNDLSEVGPGPVLRVYEVVLSALPHVQSQTLTTTEHAATTRQELVTIATGGSVRAPTTLKIYNESTALGRLLAYTCEDKGDGYRPDVGRYYTTGGGRTSESDNLSGYKHGNGAHWEFPNSELAPGPYRVFVRHTTTLGLSFGAIFQTYAGSTALGESQTLTAVSNGTYDADDYIIQALGMIHLPPVESAAEASSAVTRITAVLPDVQQIDEIWLFRDDGQLTWVEDAPKYVWLEPASVELPYGAVFMGNEADKSDAVNPGLSLKLFGRHMLEVPEGSLFLAASTALPHSTHSRYHHWHSNAGNNGG